MTRHRARSSGPRPAAVAALLALAVGLTSLRFFSEAPLWGDEVLQFAFGAYDSTAEAWHWVRATSTNINMGQTGAYIMLDFWSLKAFGASRFAMRWPSFLAGVLLAAALVRLFAAWRLPWAWGVVAIVGIHGQSCLTDLMPNARYYLPLVAGSFAVGAYYFSAPADRGRGTTALGVAGMLVGGLFHPYFPGYAAGLCLLAFGWHVDAGRMRPRLAALWAHADPRIWPIGALCWIGIGRATWMRGVPKWETDVWQFTGRGAAAAMTYVGTHLDFLAAPGPWFAVAAFAGAVALALRTAGRPDLRWSLGWLGFALASSLALSAESLRHGYPVFLRQWSVAATMLPVGFAWLGASLTRSWRPRTAGLAVAIALAVVGSRTIPRAVVWQRLAPAPAPARPISKDVRPSDMPGWVELANRNCAEGGPVYPVFRTFYRAP